MDLVIRHGTVITASTRFTGDVGIQDGKVVQLGGRIDSAESEIDASGKWVIPGGIDMHVHLSPAEVPGGTVRWADDFQSGSYAAAAGGVTTIGNITFPRPGEGLLNSIQRISEEASASSIVDFVLHPVLVDPSPETIAEIPELARRGHTSLKIFMTFGDFDARAADYLTAMSIAGSAGIITLVHCEDDCIVSFLLRQLMANGLTKPNYYPASRPVYSETVAVERAIAFSEAAEAPIYIVHLSSRDALEAVHRARARGLSVFVETRPIYLYFTKKKIEESDGALFIGNPPLRNEEDVRALWAGLRAGHIQTCCTDHAPWKRSEKLDPQRTIANALPGVADLQTLMPLLFSEGVKKGRISVERFVDVVSTNAAKIFGLYPRKGTIAIGSDADVLVWDPDEVRSVHASEGYSNADFSLHEGWDVCGWPTYTIRRGEVICVSGRVVEDATLGKVAHRGSSTEP